MRPGKRKSRRKEGVHGPWKERNGKYRVVVVDGGEEFPRFYSTEEEGKKVVAKLLAERAGRSQVTLEELIADYLESKDGDIMPGSIETLGYQLRGFFDPEELMVDLFRAGEPRGQELYDRYRKGLRYTPTKYKRQQKKRANDTHRNVLSSARSFLNWVIEEKKLQFANPLAKVKPRGMRNPNSKRKLNYDQMLKLYEYLKGEVPDDEAALPAALALAFGVRATEIVARTAHDLDCGGTKMRITRLKKREGEVVDSFVIPEWARAPLRDLATWAERNGGRLWPGRDRGWLLKNVRRLCTEAGVPIVCSHGLRSSLASARREFDTPLEQIARELGHADGGRMASAAYVSREAEVAGEQRARLRLLEGGRR